MNFELKPHNADASTGTSMISHLLEQHTGSLLLPDNRYEFFMDIDEEDCEILGTPHTDEDGSYKGYTKEWYFQAPSGSTIGIGFRWGVPRVRGDDNVTVQDAVAFVDFLRSELSET
jgi:hypothetical protein